MKNIFDLKNKKRFPPEQGTKARQNTSAVPPAFAAESKTGSALFRRITGAEQPAGDWPGAHGRTKQYLCPQGAFSRWLPLSFAAVFCYFPDQSRFP